MLLMRSDMSLIHTISFTNGFHGEAVRSISHMNGLQTFIIYSVRRLGSFQEKFMGMIEVLDNGGETLVLDWGDSDYP